jgi:hypothetical protein
MVEAIRWTVSLARGGPSDLFILGNWLCIVGALIPRKST